MEEFEPMQASVCPRKRVALALGANRPRAWRAGLIAVLAWSCCWAPGAAARQVPEPPQLQVPFGDEPPPAATAQRGPVSLQQATRMALQRYPGRVARAETVVRGARREHHIRILTEDNRVRNVRIDAESGRFL